MNVVFDLDGTLADDTHRLHHLNLDNAKRPDYEAYFAGALDDEPMGETIDTLLALWDAGHHVEIWTGRPDGTENDTWSWISRHLFKPRQLESLADYKKRVPRLRMREDNDYRPSEEVKADWLEDATQHFLRPDLVFEDRDKDVAWWRSEGIVCFQVQPRPH